MTIWLSADDLSEAASEGYDPFSVIVCSWNARKWSALHGTVERTFEEIGAVRAALQEHRKRAFAEPLSTAMPQLGFTVQTWFFVLLDALDRIAHDGNRARVPIGTTLDPYWASRIRNRYTSGDFFNAESIEEVRAMMSVWLLDEGPLDRKSVAVAAWIEQSQAFQNIAWGIRYNQPSTWPTPPGGWSRK